MTLDVYADVATVKSIGVVPKILEVACRVTGAGFAGVARVTEDRWVSCMVRDQIGFGLEPGSDLPLDNTFAQDVKQSRETIIIENAASDAHYADNPMAKMFGVQSYISVPIVLTNGTFFGTLCAIDRRPARLDTPETVAMFTLLAELIAHHLDEAENYKNSQDNLADALEVSDLREQFIAVLGHDLRNPLGAIALGASMLREKQKGPREVQVVDLISKSVGRMSELISNVLDFARGRLGAGLKMNMNGDAALLPILEHVVSELQMMWPDRVIETTYAAAPVTFCDRDRIGQLFSNLLGNALSYGPENESVRVETRETDSAFELSVSNGGTPIPPLAMSRLFQPFVRGAVMEDKQGLGLGLYIASEIARAHGGTLSATSNSVETRFTLRLPYRLGATI
jgi:signal transduction histidine kinase